MRTSILAIASFFMLFAAATAPTADAQQTQQTQQTQQQNGALASIPLVAEMSGAEIPGDSVVNALRTGKGKLILSLVPATKEVCFELMLTDVPNVTAANIHKGVRRDIGASILVLPIKTDSIATTGCQRVPDAVFADMVATPGNYYVQANSRDFPQGAVRGQLGKPEGS